jgi:hypothetical protein
MIITKLNREIIFCIPFLIVAHDQAHWNELYKKALSLFTDVNRHPN